MDVRTRREYNRLRQKDWTAQDALRSARVKSAFGRLADEGLVKLELEADDQRYDASFVDDWTDKSPARRDRIKKDILERVDREGVHIVVTYVSDGDGNFRAADSCGGFIGDDWKDSGHEIGIMLAAIIELGMCRDIHLPCFGHRKGECEEPMHVVRDVLES